MDSLKKVFSQTSWQILGKIVSSVSSLIILSLLSRHYGESGVGAITLALTFFGFFTIAADFGVNAYVLERFFGEDLTLEFRKLLGLRVFLGVILLSLGYLLSFFIFKDNLPSFEFVYFGLAFGLASSISFISANAVFQAKHRYDLSIIASSLGSLVTLGCLFLLVSNKNPQNLIVFAYIFGYLGCLSASLLSIKKFVKSFTPLFDSHYILTTFKNVWPISATLALNVIYFRLDTFLLSSFKGLSEVGIYNLAYTLFQTALVLPTFVMNGFYPIMLKQFKEGKDFSANVVKACLGMLGIAILGVLVTSVLSPWIIGIITGGQGFEGSVQALNILALSFPAFFVSSVLMWTMVVLKKYKLMLGVYLIGLLVNLILNYLFIPKYSYTASAYITGVSEYLILVLQILILLPSFKKHSK